MRISSDNNPDTKNRVALADLRHVYYFMPEEIIRLEARDNYTRFYFESRPPFVVSKVLKVYEELLRPFGFVRTHHSHLVNKQYIKRITSDSIIMQDASVAGLSRRKKTGVIRQLRALDNNN